MSAIVPQFNPKKTVSAAFELAKKRLDRAVIRILSYAGEIARNKAVSEHSYLVQTGNLAASVGYLILRDGQTVKEGGFDPDAGIGGTEGEAGAREGKQFANEIAAQQPSYGYVMVLVAGMYYGVYLEQRQYTVLTFTRLDAERIAKDLFDKLFRKR
jgi:hypothetical protein